MEETAYALKPARKTFSRIGIAMSAIVLISPVARLILLTVAARLWGSNNWLSQSSWGTWISSFLPLYAAAIPVSLLIMGKLPTQTPAEHKLKGTHFLFILPICFFLMYSGSIIGTVLSMILSGGTAENAISELATDNNPLKILVVVILAPLLEEYVCRKQIIDRTRQYGEKTAVFLSALTFGLLHQNLFQFFYAFAIGLIFAYVYLRTGRLRYSVLLHAIINFMGSVIAPLILSLVDMEKIANLDANVPTEELVAMMADILPKLLLMLLYLVVLFSVATLGLIFFILVLARKQLIWKTADNTLPKGTAAKTVYLNVGMVLYVVLCLVSFVRALF